MAKQGKAKKKGTIAGKFLSSSGGTRPRHKTTNTKNVKFNGADAKFKRKWKRMGY